MEMTDFQPESRDMAIFGKSPFQKCPKEIQNFIFG